MENSSDKNAPYVYRTTTPAPNGNPFGPFIYALILAFGVLLGFVVNTLTVGKQPIAHGGSDKISEVLDFIQAKYVDTVNQSQLTDKSISEILSNLDPHSVYLPAKDVSEANESLEGNFEGIGIEFYIVEDTIKVVTAIPGGPSEEVGMKAGDRIILINDSNVAGVKIKEADVKHKLRGPKGTKVKVSVLRTGVKHLLDFQIERDKIPLYSIDAAYMVNSDIGYVRISNFSATTHQEFVEKLTELKAHGMKKLIIDLRGNPGGYLQAATSIADELLSGNKLIVFTKGKAYDRQDYRAGKPGIFESGQLCVLIDQASASASEILSGAVQDWDRGAIIGRTSFGKGLVQEQYELEDGSALRLTVARYYTPSGRCIQRPYNKGVDEYYNDIYERYQRGEFLHEDSIVSSDTTVYKTADGRRVYGGGGIRPDIFVPMDTSMNNEYFYAVRSFVPEFVYDYSSHHNDILQKYGTEQDFKKNFEVTDQLEQQFYGFARKEGLKTNDALNRKISAAVKLNLKAFIAKQQYRMDGFYYVINDDDNVIKTAVDKLK
ncbi:MAG TPA: S41 family peptidase [Chitinophagales bacterium]|nr:S41 family peptidase [Chitinophagales bacterium]